MITNKEREEIWKQLNELRKETPHGSVGGLRQTQWILEKEQRILGIYKMPDVRSILNRICDLIEPIK